MLLAYSVVVLKALLTVVMMALRAAQMVGCLAVKRAESSAD